MASLKSIGFFMALCAAIVAAADQEADSQITAKGHHKPHFPVGSQVNNDVILRPNHHHHGHHAFVSENIPRAPQEDAENEEELPSRQFHGYNNPNFPSSESSGEGSAATRPYGPSYYGPVKNFLPLNPAPVIPEPSDATPYIAQEENAEVDQEDAEENGDGIVPLAGRVKALQDDGEVEQNDVEDESDVVPASTLQSLLDARGSIKVRCDALNSPRYSCYNCYSYLECKTSGGKIKACNDKFAPYCNSGYCSATPSSDCSRLN